MARHKMVDGEKIYFTEEEETARDEEERLWEAGTFDRMMADLRARRNKYLSDSDWAVMPDLTQLTDPVRDRLGLLWKVYRQTLRDLPADIKTVEDVKGVVWPALPVNGYGHE